MPVKKRPSIIYGLANILAVSAPPCKWAHPDGPLCAAVRLPAAAAVAQQRHQNHVDCQQQGGRYDEEQRADPACRAHVARRAGGCPGVALCSKVRHPPAGRSPGGQGPGHPCGYAQRHPAAPAARSPVTPASSSMTQATTPISTLSPTKDGRSSSRQPCTDACAAGVGGEQPDAGAACDARPGVEGQHAGVAGSGTSAESTWSWLGSVE